MMDLNEEILEADRDEIISLGEDVRYGVGMYISSVLTGGGGGAGYLS